MPVKVRILVCGSRDWKDRQLLFHTLDYYFLHLGGFVLIEGCAPGADRMAGKHPGGWARERLHGVLVPAKHFPADWNRYGKAAGPIRNTQMLREGKPDLVLAFHENIAVSKGTMDMLRQARAAGVTTELHHG